MLTRAGSAMALPFFYEITPHAVAPTAGVVTAKSSIKRFTLSFKGTDVTLYKSDEQQRMEGICRTFNSSTAIPKRKL